MSWPFLYFADERLSTAELTGARLDGDLIEVGEAYMPADAVETRELRAASLRTMIPDSLAVIGESAAWVHGAVADAPVRHTVQRRTAARLHQVLDIRLSYRDQRLAEGAAVRIGGVWVTSAAHTLADLVRALHAGDRVAVHVEALLRWHPPLAADAADVLAAGGAVHFKRPALAFLRERAAQADAARNQDDVTR